MLIQFGQSLDDLCMSCVLWLAGYGDVASDATRTT